MSAGPALSKKRPSISIAFDRRRRRFELKFLHDPSVTAPKEIFVPRLQYPDGFDVEVSNGEYRHDDALQTLFYEHDPDQCAHKIVIKPK